MMKPVIAIAFSKICLAFFTSLSHNLYPVLDAIKKQEQHEAIKKLYP